MKNIEETNWGKIIYYTYFKFHFSLYFYNDDLSTIYLSNVKVKQSERKKGYGNKILKLVNYIAKNNNFSSICLKCLKNSWVHQWYKNYNYNDLCNDDENEEYIWMINYIN